MPRDALTSQGGRFVQTSAPPGVINFGLGQPSPRLLPLAALAEAAAEQLRPDRDPLVLQYGAARGYAEFLQALAGVLEDELAVPVSPDELMVTAGTSSALALVADVLARPGDVVIAEDPTYFHARGVFESAGLEVRAVAVDEHGLDVEALRELLAGGLRPAFVYCIPAFQNPTGVSLSPARGRELVALAQAHEFWIVADEPYVALRWAGARPGSLVEHDEGRARVVSLGSFSKLLAPGLRLGWAHAAPALIERLADHGSLRSGGCLNPVIANLVHHTIDSGFLLGHIRELREVLERRSVALAAAVREHLPRARFATPSGGYFCWLDLGEGADTDALLERSAAEVRFLPGSRCAIDRDLSRCLRLSFAFYEADELVEGVERLASFTW